MKKSRKKAVIIFLALFAAVFAVVFLMPTVITFTNSFMSQSEINTNYGAVFDSDTTSYMTDDVRVKLIPDMASFSQYFTVLFQSPEYLLKFWNSVILVVPIVIFQVALAALAAYSFTRYRGRYKEILLFGYIILMLMPYQVTLVPNYLVAD